MLVLKGLVCLHRTVQLQLLSVTGWGVDLDCCDIEWFALEMNRDHSVIFEIIRVVWMWFGAFPGAFGLGRAQPQRRGTSP